VELRFLLDAQISPRVALAARGKGLDVRALQETMPADLPDREVLEYAIREGRILVTYNTGDFAILLRSAIDLGLRLPGLIFVDARSLPPDDFGGLVRALVKTTRALRDKRADASGGLFLHR
jgi:predicted nuclease of predicted toxin-antitoxin system